MNNYSYDNEKTMKNARKWMYLCLIQTSLNALGAALMWMMALIAALQNPVMLMYVVEYGILAILNTAFAKLGYENFKRNKTIYKICKKMNGVYQDYKKGKWVVVD